jgi:hypothetical protein
MLDECLRRQDDAAAIDQPVVIGVRRDVRALERIRAQGIELGQAKRHAGGKKAELTVMRAG